MAIDARIPLMGQSPDLVGSYSKGLGAASKLQDLQLQPKRNQLIDLQMQGQKDQNRSTGAKADMDELKSQYMPVAMVARKISQMGGANSQNATQINDLIVNSGAPQQSIDESQKLLSEAMQTNDFKAFDAATANILKTAQDLQIFGAPKDDSFTLTEGQSRYNSDGSLVVNNPKKGNEKSFDNSSKLRKEFTDQSKDFVKQNASMGRVDASVKDPSAAGDLALIFNYMKLLDPGSTVREGEFATAQNSAGVSQRVRAQLNQVVNGERLGKEQRDDFYNRAKMLFQEADNQHEIMIGNYRDLSTINDLNPDNVLINFRTYQAEDSDNPSSGVPITEGMTATHPQTGVKLIYRNGQWQQM